ncbi:conserved hypothetical protein [Luteimonas sp. 9C]|nr:conserved hypothetical protein [Luteimonas sp. 9C]
MLLAAVGGAVQATDTIEARNAAAGLVMTHGMFVDVTLGHWCGALPATDGPSARAAQAGWERRNAEPFLVGSLWIHALGNAVTTRMGDAAAVQFHDQRKAEFGDTVARMQQALFADGEVTQSDCARIIEAVDAGTFDVAHNPRVAETFRQMGAELVQRRAD